MNGNAVIVRAGRNSKHDHWLRGDTADFDLIVVAYEELPRSLVGEGTELHVIPGGKVAGWSKFFAGSPAILDRYERIALLDDDLICSAGDINTAFIKGHEYRLSLWQPSLTSDSFFTYALFQQNSYFELRFVNFVEMMCPFFTTDYLRACLPLFGLGYETGIDRLWCCFHPDPHKAFAVLDCVALRHTRPVGENRSAQGFVGENDSYQMVLDRMESRLNRRFRGAVAYAGVTRSGKPIEGRAKMALFAAAPLSKWPRARQSQYVKRFAILLRHILTRPLNNDSIDVGEVASKLSEVR